MRAWIVLAGIAGCGGSAERTPTGDAIDELMSAFPACTSLAWGTGRLDLEAGCVGDICVGRTLSDLENDGAILDPCDARSRFFAESSSEVHDQTRRSCLIDDGSDLAFGEFLSEDAEADGPTPDDVLHLILLSRHDTRRHTTPDGLGVSAPVSCFFDAGYVPTVMDVDFETGRVTSVRFGTISLDVAVDGRVEAMFLYARSE